MGIKGKARPKERMLTEVEAREVKRELIAGKGLSELARRFKVGVGVIKGINAGDTYRDVWLEEWKW